MDSDDTESNNKNRPHSGDQSKKKVVKIDYPVKWLKNKHSFTIAGSEFIIDERYEYVKQIGVGAYGVVISCYDKKTNHNVAIKKVGNAFEDLIDAKRIVREIKLLRYFKHDNIVSLIDIQKPPGRTGFEDIYIITDLMETDLHRVIYSRQELTDDHIQYFIYQILRGVLYMHSANIIHRDLKPANILANKNCDLKICDLGLGRAEVFDWEEMELLDKQNKLVKKTKKKKKSVEKDKKSAISNVIAAVLIFLTPTIITIIVGISFPNRDYKNCLEVKTREQINKIYIDKEEELVSLVEETINLNDYGNAKNYLQNIKDKDKVEEYSKRLGTVLEKIDELNKKPAKTVALSTGLGRDIVAKNELIEACKWVLHDEEVQILLGTCLPGPYRYPNAEDELPGGAVDISNGQAMALKTISLHEYQKGVFFGEENVQAAPNSRYAFMIIYKTVFLHNTVWRVINNELTFGKFKQIYYTAGSCSQNYRNSQRVSKYDSGIFKAEIDDTVEQTRYLVLANEDGETTDATYHSFTGIEQQIEAEGAKGTSFVDILEKVISL